MEKVRAEKLGQSVISFNGVSSEKINRLRCDYCGRFTKLENATISPVYGHLSIDHELVKYKTCIENGES